MKKIKNMLIVFLCVLSLGLGAAFAGCDSLLGGIIPQPPVESSSSQSSDEGIPPENDCANGKHAMMPVNKVIPTCITKGCDYYEVCTICNFGYDTRPILPIDPNNHLNPTKLENGQFYCSDCDTTWGEAIEEGCESGKHQMITYNAVPSTCIKQGWSMYEACELCGFGEENKKDLELDPNNHENQTKLENGQFHCNDCGRTWGGEGGSETGGCESGNHQMITYKAVPSTCITQGWSAYEACELCGFGEENKKALELDPDNHENQTTLENGQSYCEACDTTWGEPDIPSEGGGDVEEHTHVWDDGVEEVPATCGKDGVKRISCGCGASYTEPIPATGAHMTEVLYGKEATCQETGLTDGSWCPVCETVFEKQEEIPTTSHTEEILYGYEAGCENAGLSDGVWCSTCQTTLKPQETLSPLGHDEMEMSPAIQGDCITEGWTAEIYCNRCQTTIQYAEPTGLGEHVWMTYSGRPADCWTEGWESYEACALCKYGEENRVIIPFQHEWEWYERIEPTCSQEGWEAYQSCRRCGAGEESRISLGYNPENHVNVTEMDGYTYCNGCGTSWGDGSGGGDIGGEGGETGGCESGNHSFDWVPYQEATCYEQGWYPYERCTNCGYVNGEIDYIEAGHQLEYMGAQEPTCYQVGWYAYERCYRCDYSTYKEIPQLQHNRITEPGYEPTCNKPGSTGYIYCDLCGDTLKEEQELPATGEHTPYVKEAGREPTCAEWGWSDEIVCSVCGTTLQKMVEYEPLLHTPVSVLEQPASCTQKGLTAYEYCEVCKNNITEPEEIDYTFHNFPAWGEACLDCGAAYYSQGLEYYEEWYVDKIGEYHVWGLGTCTDTDLVIPDELHGVPVTEITLYSDDFVSIGAENITSLSFGSNITLVTGASFESCTNLTNVYYRGTLGEWVSAHVAGALSHNIVRTIYIDGKPVTGDIVIPDDVTSISSYAFIHQPITSITMGDQVESLGMMAFYNCKNLVTARLSANIKTIDWDTFSYCTSLTKVEMDGVETLDHDAFSNCQSLLSVYLPSVTSIGMRAFECCYSLEEVVCGENLTTIGSSAFQDCTSLNSITLPDALTKIDTYAFNGCESLEGFVVGLNVTFIGSRAFADCTSLKEVIFQVPEGWTYTRSGTVYNIIGLDDAETAVSQFAGMAGGYNWTRTE